ncbi:MAG: phage holin family protein [Bacilli bacterium]|nr:phage holin family protein [Bacilli bacterium]
MKLLIKEKNKYRINYFFDWLFHIIAYTIVFILITTLFKTIYVDSNNLILWSSIIVIVLYVLNKTIKPVLVTLTIPITGITLGLFYPCINVLILKLTDWLLGKHFEITSLLSALIFAILLSISTFIVNEIIKKIIDKVKR